MEEKQTWTLMVSFRGPGGIYGIFSHPAGKRVVETDGVGMDLREYGFQPGCERFFRRIIGPQGEHPARGQMSSQFRQTFGRIKTAVGPVQDPVGGVVDVQKDEVLFFSGKCRIKSLFHIPASGEKIVMDHPASGIRAQLASQGHQMFFVPADYRFQILHHHQ